jgi:hypothetical protein
MQDNGLGRENRLPACAKCLPGPGEIFSEVHVGEGDFPEDAGTDGAGDVVEA